MRRITTVMATAAALTGSIALAEPASGAPPIRECGDIRAELAFNITSRAVSCREARRVARAWNGRGTVRVRGLACKYRDTGYEAGDIRCTGTRGRVVRWQTGV